jgi:hypothetical protein
MEFNDEELKILSLEDLKEELKEGEKYFIQFYKKNKWFGFGNYDIKKYNKKYTFIKEYIEIHNAYISIKTYIFRNEDNINIMFELSFINILEGYVSPVYRYKLSFHQSYDTSITCDIYSSTNITNEYILK